MLIMYYCKWNGSAEELTELIGRFQGIWDEIEGAEMKGVYSPITQNWSLAFHFETDEYDKALKAYSNYIKKYGPHPKVSGQKVEIFHTFQELGTG